ncbi:MAG TPA: hypothetical protein VNO79_16000 [Actinomycetota bacterium]|nr:hypothetical protein [Actinomycetota bacterium]
MAMAAVGLGEVLEVIHSSPRRFRTVRAAGRTGDAPWRLWWAGDARWRFEEDHADGSNVQVRAGHTWWTVGPSGEVHTNEGDPGIRLGMPAQFGLLHTRGLLACAILRVLREERVAGRRAAVLRATPRPRVRGFRWWHLEGWPQPLDVPIDLERGVALGTPWWRVDEIAFDEDLAPEVFSRPPEDLPVVRHPVRPLEVTLEEARRRAGFPVILPASLPHGARFLRCLLDPAEPPGWVDLTWAIDPGHLYVVRLRQGPEVARDAARARGRVVLRGDTRILVEEEEGVRWRRLFVERGGRWFEVESDLPTEAAVGVAASLGEGP